MSEMINNTEVIENVADAAEEIIEAGSENGLKGAAIVAGSMLAGAVIGIAASKLAKPVAKGAKKIVGKITKKSDADDDIIDVKGYVTVDEKNLEEGK